MISASKTTFSLINLKILRPKITIILRICLRSFVNLHPVVPFYDIKGDGKMLSILTPRLLLFALFTHPNVTSYSIPTTSKKYNMLSQISQPKKKFFNGWKFWQNSSQRFETHLKRTKPFFSPRRILWPLYESNWRNIGQISSKTFLVLLAFVWIENVRTFVMCEFRSK